MKHIIFYFTGTGNSLSAARAIGNRLEDAVLLPVLEGVQSDSVLDQAETIGLVYPVYMNALPKPIDAFIKSENFRKGVYTYALATHCGVPGKSGSVLLEKMKSEGVQLDAYFQVRYLANSPKGVAPKPLMTLDWEKHITEEIVDGMILRTDEKLGKIIDDIKTRKSVGLDKLERDSRAVGFKIMQFLTRVGKPPKLNFILDSACIGCGKCQEVCTTERIKMSQGLPVWVNDNCNYCYACFNYCPVQAIGVKHYTKKEGRYHHPDVTAEDIKAQKSNSN